MPDGGRNPTFDEKFHIPLIEGLRELNVVVWNSNTLTHDDFIGSEYICTRCLQMDMMIPHGHFRHAT